MHRVVKSSASTYANNELKCLQSLNEALSDTNEQWPPTAMSD